MADGSNIEWTDATWNPARGCSRLSPGCGGPGKAGGCYAERMAARFSEPGQRGHGFAEMRNGEPHWTGRVELIESHLALPLSWKKPRHIFVNSTSDLFHEKLPDEAIDRVFAVMALCADIGRRHTFQILTKRAERMRTYIARKCAHAPEWINLPGEGAKVLLPYDGGLPKFIWLGVSAERQQEADERIPHLLETPAAVRFVSLEPLLGPIQLHPLGSGINALSSNIGPNIDWVIVGGESGPGARPMHPEWARDLRDQCKRAGVPYFHKQNGEFETSPYPRPGVVHLTIDGRQLSYPTDDSLSMRRVGKKRAGRLLEGVEHNDFPEMR